MKVVYLLAFLSGGALFGSMMGYYGKCSSGACPLTANPFRGAIWGAFIGALLGFSFMQGGSSAVAAESQNLVQINGEEEFNAKIASGKGVAVVDFYADWCPPCKALAPIFAKTADAYAGKASFYKLDTDKNQALSKKFNIEGIPCVVLFKDGKEASRVVGLANEAKYKEEIDKLLK